MPSDSALQRCSLALLLIDVINDLEFPGGERLLEHALPMAERIAGLKRRAKELGIPVIYVNDNYGQWRADFAQTVEHCCGDGVRGREISRLLRPDENDYFVLKPKHSGFFSTTLDTLLDHLGTRTLILTGTAGNLCIWFTAGDAYMRDFQLLVPEDCVASESAEINRLVLEQMRENLDADTTPSTELPLKELMRAATAT